MRHGRLSRSIETSASYMQKTVARFSVSPPSDAELRGDWRTGGERPLKPLTVLEGAVDDPLLANPRQRHERLGTGWFGVIFEFEGVLVASAHKDHLKAWQEVCKQRGTMPPMFLLERAEGMKSEQVCASFRLSMGLPKGECYLLYVHSRSCEFY
jgi:hypothetical protein